MAAVFRCLICSLVLPYLFDLAPDLRTIATSTRDCLIVDDQVKACVEKIFGMPGLRFLFTIRSSTPSILGPDGAEYYKGREFIPGVDDIIIPGTAGFIIAFGDALYRAADAVQRLKAEGIDVGLICKATINVSVSEVKRFPCFVSAHACCCRCPGQRQ